MQVVGVQNKAGTICCNATGLYNKHRKYSERWSRRHLICFAHNILKAQLFGQQTTTLIEQHLRCALDNNINKSFQSADTIRKVLSGLDFTLGIHSVIEDDSHHFGTLFYRHILKCIHFHLAHHPVQAHRHCEPAPPAGAEGHRIYRRM